MHAYVNAIGLISPQHTLENDFTCNLPHEGEVVLRCQEPVYKELINPVQLRRMSRILKLSLAASQLCLNRAGECQPDAIVVGTGLGCVNDLELFLTSMLKENEQSLSPIPFINSSHNTVAAQIARNLQNHGYNSTFCHRGISFESALQDALMLIHGNEANNVLLGGVDEFSEHYYALLNQLGMFKNDNHAYGALCGEGAGFFLLSNHLTDKTYSQIRAVHSAYSSFDAQDIHQFISTFLLRNNLSISDITHVMLGISGDRDSDAVYADLTDNYLPAQSSVISYKHLCGEYTTSGAFALALASDALLSGCFPASSIYRQGNAEEITRVLIYNHYRNTNHSAILVEKV